MGLGRVGVVCMPCEGVLGILDGKQAVGIQGDLGSVGDGGTHVGDGALDGDEHVGGDGDTHQGVTLNWQ